MNNNFFCVKNSRAFSLIELSIVVLIIGILIAGVTQGSRLVALSKIKTAQNLTTASPINSIPDLAMWIEPTLDGSLVTSNNDTTPSNGDSIITWSDINSQLQVKTTLSAPTVGSRPQYMTNIIGNLPSMYFNGSNYLQIDNGTGPIFLNNPNYTMVAVFKQTGSNSSDKYIVAQEGSGGKAASFLVSTGSGPYFSASNDNSPAPSAALNKVFIMIAAIKGQSASIYYNSNTKLSYTLSGSNPNNTGPSSTQFSIGALFDNGWNTGFVGFISEVIIFNRTLKQTEINDINNYLATKYSVTLS